MVAAMANFFYQATNEKRKFESETQKNTRENNDINFSGSRIEHVQSGLAAWNWNLAGECVSKDRVIIETMSESNEFT